LARPHCEICESDSLTICPLISFLSPQTKGYWRLRFSPDDIHWAERGDLEQAIVGQRDGVQGKELKDEIRGLRYSLGTRDFETAWDFMVSCPQGESEKVTLKARLQRDHSYWISFTRTSYLKVVDRKWVSRPELLIHVTKTKEEQTSQREAEVAIPESSMGSTISTNPGGNPSSASGTTNDPNKFELTLALGPKIDFSAFKMGKESVDDAIASEVLAGPSQSDPRLNNEQAAQREDRSIHTTSSGDGGSSLRLTAALSRDDFAHQFVPPQSMITGNPGSDLLKFTAAEELAAENSVNDDSAPEKSRLQRELSLISESSTYNRGGGSSIHTVSDI
jgi:hypothetical protein